jgi:hypothetical protein
MLTYPKRKEKKSLYIKGTFFANKVLLSFDDNVIIWLGTDLFTLEDVFYDTYLRLNLFKEGEDDTNQVRFEFDFKIYGDQFWEIEHVSQIVHRNEIKLYRKILDICNYSLVYFSSQMKFINILFHMVKFTRQI